MQNNASQDIQPRSENLALLFQELLTIIGRMRSGRQEVSSAEVFRSQALQALEGTRQQAQSRGYSGEDIQLATFAVVAYVDESVLNLRHAVFKDWARRPLQEELFGRHIAGETFFTHLDKLLQRPDSPHGADVVEVYYLCLLLGYLGRYSIASKGELHSLMQRVENKLARIRGSNAEFSPSWRLPEEPTHPVAPSRWQAWLRFAALGSLSLAAVLFATYWLVLAAGVARLAEVAAGAR